MEIRSYVDDHVKALYRQVNLDACKIFYLGFGTTFFTGGDGLSLFNKSHTFTKPGLAVMANTFPSGDTHRPFGPQALIDAINYMDRFTGMNGEEFSRCRNLRVICAKELAPTVWKTIQSTYGPLTSNLGLNEISKEALSSRGVSIDYVVAQDIPSAYKNYWFIVDLERAQKMALMDWAWKPRLNETWDYRKGNFISDGSVNFAPRITSWQFSFGSKGDGSAA